MNKQHQSGESFGLERLAQLLEALPVGVYILGADGVAIYANHASHELLGRGIGDGDEAANLGDRYPSFLAGTRQRYPTERMPIVRALSGERSTVDDLEVDRNGEIITLEVTGTPIFDRDGRVLYAVAVFQDITARKNEERAIALLNEELELEVQRRTSDLAQTVTALKREIAARRSYENELLVAKSEAERANRAKGVFLMNVSHELRTPLHQIIGFSDLLAERLSEERSRKHAEGSGTSARELLEKVDALIDLARADTAEPPSTFGEFDLDAAIRTVSSAFGLRCDLDPPLGLVLGCEDVVRQMLTDLCRAGESIPEFAEAVLTARTEGENGCQRFVLCIPGERLAQRVEALGGIFGDTPKGEMSRYQQQPLDLRLAVARTQARRLGGDLVAPAGASRVELSFFFEDPAQPISENPRI